MFLNHVKSFKQATLDIWPHPEFYSLQQIRRWLYLLKVATLFSFCVPAETQVALATTSYNNKRNSGQISGEGDWNVLTLTFNLQDVEMIWDFVDECKWGLWSFCMGYHLNYLGRGCVCGQRRQWWSKRKWKKKWWRGQTHCRWTQEGEDGGVSFICGPNVSKLFIRAYNGDSLWVLIILLRWILFRGWLKPNMH